MNAFLEIRDVSKRFGAVTALSDVRLAIARAEFFSLLGPSGCGKTTLLRTIAGFEQPDEGTIFIDGADVTAMPPERRPTNMVFQSYAIFPHLNVFDNIAYGLRRLRLERAELERRVSEALAMVRLDGYGGRRSDTLSGGQRQRVALARALVRRPKVLLLDEPLGALDRRLREAMQRELRELQRNLGITFVLVTHDQEEALSMSDRIAVMSEGRVLQVDSPRALYERPASRIVAEFIGTMNLLEATVTEGAGSDAVCNVPGLGAIVVKDCALAAGERATLAIRPERLVISDGGRTSGTIVSSTYLGGRTHLLIALEGNGQPVAATIDSASGAGASPGARIKLDWEPDAFIALPD